MIEGKIASELKKLAAKDIRVREALLAENSLADGYNPIMEAVHKENAARLRVMIKQIGWPTPSKVGVEASDAAWLIAQHAIGEANLMRHCYELMKESVDEVNAQHLAYLHDRICFFEARPQRYGTQSDDEGMYPVEDERKLTSFVYKWTCRYWKRTPLPLPGIENSCIHKS